MNYRIKRKPHKPHLVFIRASEAFILVELDSNLESWFLRGEENRRARRKTLGAGPLRHAVPMYFGRLLKFFTVIEET